MTALEINVQDTVTIVDRVGEAAGIRLDIGCGANKQQGAGWIGMDVQALPGVDIVHNLVQFPWPLEDESVLVAMASHILEHIPPEPPDPRLTALIDLLISRGILSEKDVAEVIGTYDPGPLFIAVMNEVWRVMKPGGQFAIVVPHGYSPGFLQDPTHVNPISEHTWSYFNKEHPFWHFYKPKPWKTTYLSFDYVANVEVVLVKEPE